MLSTATVESCSLNKLFFDILTKNTCDGSIFSKAVTYYFTENALYRGFESDHMSYDDLKSTFGVVLLER